MSTVAQSRPLPKQQRGIVTRAAILNAAARTFVAHGFAEATLARIRTESGLTNGAFYHHFPTREAVAVAVVDEYVLRAQNAMTVAAASSSSGIETLLRVSEVFAGLVQSDVFVRAGIVLTTEVGITIPMRAPYESWVNMVAALVEQCQREGSVRSDLDPHEVSVFLVSSLTGLQFLSNALSKHGDLVSHVGCNWLLLLVGLVPPEGQGQVRELLATTFTAP